MGRCGCQDAQCSCQLVAGENTTVNGNGETGTPYQVNVSCEAIQDCLGQALGCGLQYDDAGNQISVRISSQSGNTIQCLPDGLYSVAGALQLGCGLETDLGTGAVQVNGVSPETFTRTACNLQVETNVTEPLPNPGTDGVGVYCDPNGELRTLPEKFTETRAVSNVFTFTPSATIPQVGNVETPIQTVQIVNPSPYFCLCGYLQLAAQFTIDAGPNANPRMDFVFDLDGDGVLNSATSVWSEDTRGGPAVKRLSDRPVEVLNLCLQPGESRIISVRQRFLYSTAHAGGSAEVSAVAREIRFVGTNV